MLSSIKWLWMDPRCRLSPRYAPVEAPLWLYGLLLFYTVSLYTSLGERLGFLAAIRHEFVLAILMIGFCTAFLMINPPPLRGEGRLLGAAGVYLVSVLIQIPLAVMPDIAKEAFMDTMFKHVVFAFFVIVLVRSPRQMIGLYGAWMFSLFWVYQEAVRGLITGSLVWSNQGIRRLHGAVDLYGHANGLSLIACTFLPFFLYFLPVFKRIKPIVLFLVVTAVMAGLCIIYTGSRAGYVGTLGMFPFWLMTRPNKARNFAILAVCLSIVIAVMPDQYKGRFESITGEEVAGKSREARVQIIVDAWEVFKIYPFGTGIDGFPVVRNRMFGRVQDTHNLYMQILTHIGIQGMVTFVFLVASMFASLAGTIKRLDQLLAVLRRAGREGSGDPREDRRLRIYHAQIRVLQAGAMGTRLFLFFMLVNGIFAHTLYLVSWWFVLAQAYVLGEMSRYLLDAALVRRDGLLRVAGDHVAA